MKKAVLSGSARWPLIVVLLSVTLALLAGGYEYYRSESDRIRQQKYEDLAAIAELKAGQIQQWRKERLEDIGALSRGPMFKRTLEPWLRDRKNEALLADLKERLVEEQRTGGYADAILLSPDAKILLSAQPQPDPLSTAAKVATEEALAERSPVLSDLYRNPQGTVLIDAVAPILDPKGQPIAAVLFRSNAESLLYPLIQSWPTSSRTAETLLIRKDGDGVLFLNDLRHQPNTALSLREPFTLADLPAVQAVQGKKGMFQGRDYRGVDVLADLRSVPDSPWFMVAKVDTAEILAEARYRGVVIALFSVLFILLAAGATAYGYRHSQAHLYRGLYRSERERRAAQEEFRTTLYSIGDAVITTDTAGLVKQMNPTAERLTGWLEAEANGKPIDEIFHIVNEDSRKKVENPFQRVLNEGTVIGLANHTLLISKDGSESPIADSGAPIRDEGGGITGVVLVFRDQAEERWASKALKKSEERLRLAQDAANSGTWEWDLRTNENFWSHELWGLYGLEPYSCEPSYEAWLETIHPDDRAEAERAVQKAASNRTELNAEWRTNDSKGGERWLMSRGRPVKDASGQASHYIGIVMDITDRKRAEESLRQSEQRYRRLHETMRDAFVQVDMSGLITDFNAAFQDMLGYQPEELRQLTYSDLTPKKWHDLEARIVSDEILPLGESAIYEKEYVRKDGSVLPVELRTSLITDDNGKPSAMWAIVREITERKRAEEVLKESEKKFRLLYEEAPVAYQSLDEDGHMLGVNATWLQLLGYTRDEVIGKSFDDFLTPGSQARFREAFTEFKRAGQVHGVEHEMVCKDKSVIDVSIDGRISRAEGGKFGHTHCVFQDVTQRKRSEKALQESERRYRATFNIASVGIDLVDRDGRFLEANATLSQFLGYTSEELRDLTILDVTHPEDVSRSWKMHEAMVQGETDAYRLEKRYVRKDGSILWADTAVSAIRDADGQYRATVGVISDITERKQSEEARIRLTAAVEQAAETVEITDPQGIIVYVNPSFERTTGYSRQEAVGKNPRFLKSGYHDDEFYKRMWDDITSGKIWTGHLINKKKDGTLFEEDVTISPVKDDFGEIVNYVAVKRDVTAEVSLQRQLLQSQKMEAIGTLAGGIAHDFNNILQVAMGYSELLLAGKSAKDPDRDDLRKILHAARSGADLVRNLLTFSRKVESKPVPMDLNNQVRNVEKLLRRTIPRMIEIRLELADGLKRINADPGQIEQIIMNFAVNARDAMGENGSLTIRTEDVVLDEEYCRANVGANPGDYVLLSVSDTGSGMDKKTLQHIFEPFYTTKELGRGTGLGLAMVYGIVKLHDGHLTCYSELGKGTTFRVYFPAILSKLEEVAESVAEMPAFGTETLLLADDEDPLRELGERILTKRGYTVISAANGEEALALYKKKKEQISLVILDLIMPSMGGKDCLLELIKIDPAVKVLIASGYAANETTRECLRLGAKGFVAKPFKLKELLLQVRNTLDQS